MNEASYVRTVKEVRESLEGMHIPAVAKETGLPYMTVKRIADGRTKRPQEQTLTILSDYVEDYKNKLEGL